MGTEVEKRTEWALKGEEWIGEEDRVGRKRDKMGRG